jgi:hypothetical protein
VAESELVAVHGLSAIERLILLYPLTLGHLLVNRDFALRQQSRLSNEIIWRSGFRAKYDLARILSLI